MKDNYTVYMHISPSNKRYIGITSCNPKDRWKNGQGYKYNEYFTNAINKYKWESFQHIIIAKGLTKYEAEWLEIELIKEFDTTNREKGYNISLGGGSGNHSEETKKKISKTLTGYKHSEETKKKQSKRWLKEKNPNYGKDMSGENNPSSKKIICLETNEIFNSLREASESVNGVKSNLCRAIKNHRKYKGYTFDYYKPVEKVEE